MRDEKLKHRARDMRTRPTDAERKLGQYLRNGQLGGWRFRRQRPIPPYILDFACMEVCAAVEVDGGRHAESNYDAARDEFLRKRGWRVLRFWNTAVMADCQGVAATILAALGGIREEDAGPHPNPRPLGGGGKR